MRLLLVLLCGAALSAVAEEGVAQEQPVAEDTLDVEAILQNPLSEDDYRERDNCIYRRSIDDVEVLDENLVLFHGRTGRLWLNQLGTTCHGLDADMIVQLRSYGGSFCRMDRFRGIPRFATFAITAECRLGDFESVDELQVEALKAAIGERRQAQDMAKKTRRSAQKGDAKE